MKLPPRSKHLGVTIVAVICGGFAACVALQGLIDYSEINGTESSKEWSVSSSKVTHAILGLPIRAERAYQASSHDGFHGDGKSAMIVKFPSHQSEQLIEILNRRHPDYEWEEEIANWVIGTFRKLLPREFLPSSEDAEVIGWAHRIAPPPIGKGQFGDS